MTFALATMKLEMSDEKTVVTHAATGRAKFLGYEVYRSSRKNGRHRNGRINLSVPKDTVHKLLRRYASNGKGIRRTHLLNHSVQEIIQRYDTELRGYYNYYKLAFNVSNNIGRVKFFMWQSLVHTIANKKKLSVKETLNRYTLDDTQYSSVIGIKLEDDKGRTKTFSFANYPLTWVKISYDGRAADPYNPHLSVREITRRILQTTCELCGATDVKLEAHHIRRMKDVRRSHREGGTPTWKVAMASINRKSLMVCHECHQRIHSED